MAYKKLKKLANQNYLTWSAYACIAQQWFPPDFVLICSRIKKEFRPVYSHIINHLLTSHIDAKYEYVMRSYKTHVTP